MNTQQLLADLPISERPQERLRRSGAAALSDRELLAILLRSGTAQTDVLAVSHQLLQRSGSLAALMRWSAEDFQQIPGIGPVKSLQLLSVIEVAKRILLQKEGDLAPFDSPERVFRYFHPLTAGLNVEKFWVLCLNRKNYLLKKTAVTSGTVSSSLVHPREVFREAINCSASAIIAVHNHPSGDPGPSQMDIQATRQLKHAADIVGIDLLDHIIIGTPQRDPHRSGYYSFQESGLLKG